MSNPSSCHFAKVPLAHALGSDQGRLQTAPSSLYRNKVIARIDDLYRLFVQKELFMSILSVIFFHDLSVYIGFITVNRKFFGYMGVCNPYNRAYSVWASIVACMVYLTDSAAIIRATDW